jgi:hypothetical protein
VRIARLTTYLLRNGLAGCLQVRSRRPSFDLLRLHHTIGISRFPITIDDTSSTIPSFLNHGVLAHRETVRMSFGKLFLPYSPMPVIWGILGSLG